MVLAEGWGEGVWLGEGGWCITTQIKLTWKHLMFKFKVIWKWTGTKGEKRGYRKWGGGLLL